MGSRWLILAVPICLWGCGSSPVQPTPTPTPNPTPTSIPTPSPGLPPVARDDSYAMTRGTTLTIGAPGVLANDTIPANANPQVQFYGSSVGSNPPPGGLGSFTSLAGGGFVWDLTLNPATTGTFVFYYVVHTGVGDSNIAAVTVTVSPPTAPANNVVVYEYYEGASSTERTLVEDGVSFARGYLERTFGWSITQGLRVVLTSQAGPPTAMAINNVITIYGTNIGWTQGPNQNRWRTLAHELFHIYQQNTSWGNRQQWIIEGSAEFIGFQVGYVERGLITRQRLVECHIDVSLRQNFPSLSDTFAVATGEAYSYVALANDFLVGDNIPVLKKLENATPFDVAFGRATTDFYQSFDRYKTTWMRKPGPDCPR